MNTGSGVAVLTINTKPITDANVNIIANTRLINISDLALVRFTTLVILIHSEHNWE